MSTTNRFNRVNQPITCENCGKRTTSFSSGGGNLCGKCDEMFGIENEHNDGDHDDSPRGDCHLCKAEKVEELTEETITARQLLDLKPGVNLLVRLKSGRELVLKLRQRAYLIAAGQPGLSRVRLVCLD